MHRHVPLLKIWIVFFVGYWQWMVLKEDVKRKGNFCVLCRNNWVANVAKWIALRGFFHSPWNVCWLAPSHQQVMVISCFFDGKMRLVFLLVSNSHYISSSARHNPRKKNILADHGAPPRGSIFGCNHWWANPHYPVAIAMKTGKLLSNVKYCWVNSQSNRHAVIDVYEGNRRISWWSVGSKWARLVPNGYESKP